MVYENIEVANVSYLQVLDKDGNVDKEQLPQDLSEDNIKELYHLMKLLRVFDEKLFHLQRSGKIGTFAQNKGQEASEIGSGYVLQEQDWFVPSFRELGVYLCRGADRGALVQVWNGDTRALANPNHTHNLPVAIPIASQLLHATGVSWASKIQQKDEVTIVYFGEGATSEGDFHEALNFASTLNLPIVFFCQRNGWAISTPTTKEMNSKTIAQKASAYDMAGVQVDGNDVLGVYKATSEAFSRARKGEGPTLVESVTYRMGDHTTSDDSSKYRSEDEIKEWEEKDPLLRLEKYFQNIGTWSEDYGNWVAETVSKEVDEAVEKGFAVDPPKPEQMFEDVYVEMPAILKEEQEEFLAELEAENKSTGTDSGGKNSVENTASGSGSKGSQEKTGSGSDGKASQEEKTGFQSGDKESTDSSKNGGVEK